MYCMMQVINKTCVYYYLMLYTRGYTHMHSSLEVEEPIVLVGACRPADTWSGSSL